MRGKSWRTHPSMYYKTYYCSKCGKSLENHKTHRIVTEKDLDYFQYQKRNRYPRVDYDVFDYEFKCPSCGTHIAFDEQCIISKIQKKCNSRILSQSEIKSNYEECKKKHFNNKLRNAVLFVVIPMVIFGIVILFNSNITSDKIWIFVLFFALYILLMLALNIGNYLGKSNRKYGRNYTPEKEAILKKYHAYCSNNKSLIMKTEKCYCFHCKELVDSDKVTYIDDEKTGLCPNCGVDSLIPDNVEGITKELINEMNEYWF